MSNHTSTVLAREIYDEFLACKICLSAYKNPKCLDCLHTFCEKCIEDQFLSKSPYKQFTTYREFLCPVCNKHTPLPGGSARMLPDNFTVASLMGFIGPQCPDTATRCPSCDICKRMSRKHSDATVKCLDCAKLLCAECVQIHSETKVTSGHSLIGIQVEKGIQCKDHPEEAVRFFCIQCDACVCVLCTFNKHLDHRVIQFTEAISNCRGHIRTLLASCKGKSRDADHWLEAVTNCDNIVTMTTEKIKDTADQQVQDIRNAEQQLLEELRNMVGPVAMSQLERKKELVALADSMRQTCDLSDIILGGKDMELLLLKKDVEEKLQAMIDLQIDDLPEHYGIGMDYVSGIVNLGHLLDSERPVPLRVQVKKQNKSICREAGSQTAPETPEKGGTQKNVVQAARVHAGTMTENAGDSGRKQMDTGSATLSPLSPQAKNQPEQQNGQEPVRRRRREPSLGGTKSGNGGAS